MTSYLDTYKNIFINCASGLGDYEKLSETELANGHCDAEEQKDEEKKSQYYAALMLRYWYKIYLYKQSSSSTRLQPEDFIEWLEEALNIAFQYKEWRDPTSTMYKDPKAVDKIINRCCFSVRGLYYQHFNKDVRKINYICDSIESQLEQFGEAAKANVASEESYDVMDLVNHYLSKGKYQEAVIIDGIAFLNSFKEEKYDKYVNDLDADTGDIKLDENGNNIKVNKTYKHSVFDERKLVKELTHLTDAYWNKFQERYDIEDKNKFKEFITSFSKIKSAGMYPLVDGLIAELKEKAGVLL